MWTDTTRRWFARSSLRLPSDLIDAEWLVLEPLFPARSHPGRPPVWGYAPDFLPLTLSMRIADMVSFGGAAATGFALRKKNPSAQAVDASGDVLPRRRWLRQVVGRCDAGALWNRLPWQMELRLSRRGAFDHAARRLRLGDTAALQLAIHNCRGSGHHPPTCRRVRPRLAAVETDRDHAHRTLNSTTPVKGPNVRN